MADVNKVHEHKGKIWVFLCLVPYKKASGSWIELEKWTSTCDKCGVPISVKIPIGSVLWSNSFGQKHCDEHKLTKAQTIERWKAGIQNGSK